MPPAGSAGPEDTFSSLRRFGRSPLGRHGVALLAVVAAVSLQRLAWPFISSSPFLFFYLAVMLAGWWGGWGPGLLATTLSALAIDFFFLPPFGAILTSPEEAIALGLFTLLSLLMTWLNVSLRRMIAERAALLSRERLARSEAEAERARLHDLFMQAPAFIALFRGPQHIYTLSNPLTEELLAERGFVGKPIREATPDAVRQGFVAILDRVYATGEPFVTRELPLSIAQPDGSERRYFLNCVFQPTRDAHGAIDGIASFGFDVTKQRHTEEELKRAESRSRFLAEASAVLASSLDYEATLRNVARLAVPALADWCMVDLEQADGTYKRVEVAAAAPEDAELARQVLGLGLMPQGNADHPPTRALLRGEPILIEQFTPERIRLSANTEEHARIMEATRMLSLAAVPLVARGRVLGVLTFLTSRSGRRYQATDLPHMEELAHRVALSVENALLYQRAQEAIRLRDEFLSIASHELKTPLTPLSLKLQMLAREAQRQPESPFRRAVEDYVATGSRQVKKLSELVSDLLDVARIAGGRLRLELEEVELSTLTREVVRRHEPEAARVGSPLLLEVQEPVVGRWDRLRLEQVLTNLVDNAIKYGAGKPVHVHLHGDADRVHLRVRDEGIGIAPEHLSRIFERFERAVSDRHYGGLGLGLYITRTIVEAMGGSIQVESSPGHGAMFTVVLPREPKEAQDSSVEPPGPEPALRDT